MYGRPSIVSASTQHIKKEADAVKIIAISGKAQHGKDTTAGFLKSALEADGYKVQVAHYADLLKYITSLTNIHLTSRAFLQSVPLLSCVRKTMSCMTTTINSFTPISGFLCRPNAPFRKNCGCALFWMRSVPAVVSPTSIWSRISPIRIWHGRCSTRLHGQALSTLHLTPASTNASIITVS